MHHKKITFKILKLDTPSKCPLLFIFFVMDVLLRCNGPPLSQTNLYPLYSCFFRVLYCRQQHSSGAIFHAKKQEKGSFSSSSPIHDIMLTSRGAHQTTFLFILTWLQKWSSSLWSADLGVLFSLLLCSSCSCSHQQLFGPSFKHNPFLWLLSYIQHSSNSFSNPLQGTQLMLLCVLLLKTFLNSEKSLFWKSCSIFLEGLNFVFESCYIFLCFEW